MKRITIDEVKTNLAQYQANSFILDVRTPDEYRESHIAGAVNCDHESVPAKVTSIKALAGNRTILVLCRAGRRAEFASAALEAAGVKDLVCVSTGGMGDYSGPSTSEAGKIL